MRAFRFVRLYSTKETVGPKHPIQRAAASIHLLQRGVANIQETLAKRTPITPSAAEKASSSVMGDSRINMKDLTTNEAGVIVGLQEAVFRALYHLAHAERLLVLGSRKEKELKLTLLSDSDPSRAARSLHKPKEESDEAAAEGEQAAAEAPDEPIGNPKVMVAAFTSDEEFDAYASQLPSHLKEGKSFGLASKEVVSGTELARYLESIHNNPQTRDRLSRLVVDITSPFSFEVDSRQIYDLNQLANSHLLESYFTQLNEAVAKPDADAATAATMERLAKTLLPLSVYTIETSRKAGNPMWASINEGKYVIVFTTRIHAIRFLNWMSTHISINQAPVHTVLNMLHRPVAGAPGEYKPVLEGIVINPILAGAKKDPTVVQYDTLLKLGKIGKFC